MWPFSQDGAPWKPMRFWNAALLKPFSNENALVWKNPEVIALMRRRRPPCFKLPTETTETSLTRWSMRLHKNKQ